MVAYNATQRQRDLNTFTGLRNLERERERRYSRKKLLEQEEVSFKLKYNNSYSENVKFRSAEDVMEKSDRYLKEDEYESIVGSQPQNRTRALADSKRFRNTQEYLFYKYQAPLVIKPEKFYATATDKMILQKPTTTLRETRQNRNTFSNRLIETELDEESRIIDEESAPVVVISKPNPADIDPALEISKIITMLKYVTYDYDAVKLSEYEKKQLENIFRFKSDDIVEVFKYVKKNLGNDFGTKLNQIEVYTNKDSIQDLKDYYKNFKNNTLNVLQTVGLKDAINKGYTKERILVEEAISILLNNLEYNIQKYAEKVSKMGKEEEED